MAAFIKNCFLFIAILKTGVISKNPPPIHSDVVSKLLQDYNPALLPQKSTNHTVYVAAGLALIHVDQLSETGVLSATAWLRIVWNDYRLVWNESDYGGVTVIRLDPKNIWLPDIEIYNTADPSQFSLASQYNTGANALIYPDGEVLYIPPVHLKVLCYNFTHSNWPQGEQQCNFKLGSWTHSGDILNLTLFNNKEEIDLSDFNPSSPWVITQQLGKVRNEKFYPCCEEPYQDLNFRFKLKPQYPMYDPFAVSRLLDQQSTVLSRLLVAAVIILLVVMVGVGGIAWLILKGRILWGHTGTVIGDKKRILREETYSQSMENFSS
eukprot:GFUD01039758.1.p1 GENE.GFUD01039758.1~~GFUD01039758.1.p1  ORF type:complete len:322 (-),score=43.69 GFUD01039758.1:186-1151(-)